MAKPTNNVFKQILRQAQNDNKPSTTINVQGLNKGLYLVKVITVKGEVKNEKLVVE